MPPKKPAAPAPEALRPALDAKSDGNDAFRKRRYKVARMSYGDAITLAERAVAGLAADGDKSDDPLVAASRDLRAQIYTNRAMCAFKESDFRACVDDATSALLLEPQREKALFWRSEGRVKMGDVGGAVIDREFGVRLYSSMLCCGVLCCALLSSVLFCSVLFCSVLFKSALLNAGVGVGFGVGAGVAGASVRESRPSPSRYPPDTHPHTHTHTHTQSRLSSSSTQRVPRPRPR